MTNCTSVRRREEGGGRREEGGGRREEGGGRREESKYEGGGRHIALEWWVIVTILFSPS